MHSNVAGIPQNVEMKDIPQCDAPGCEKKAEFDTPGTLFGFARGSWAYMCGYHAANDGEISGISFKLVQS